MDSYARVTSRLEAAVAELGRIAAERGSEAVAAGAERLRAKLQGERFNVVIVGEFKRGKTTFVNALLGAEILPSAVVPLTSIVTAVRWGERVGAEVTFAGDRTERIAIDELPRYVTERENPGNLLGVERAAVAYPSEYLRDGVFLVDTPGVGSVYGHNTDAAYAFVPESDVAIFVTSADPPISANERRFLEDVRAEAARMFFVLNKVDYLSGADLEESIGFTERVLGEALGRDVAVHPVSARAALRAKEAGDGAALERSGLAAFEDAFQDFLLREKGATIVRSVASSIGKLVADERNSLDVHERAARLPAEELERVSAEMERVFVEAALARDDSKALLKRHAERLMRTVEEDLREFRLGETPAIVEEAERFLAGAEDVRAAAAQVDGRAKEQLRVAVDRWRVREERRIGDEFTAGTRRFVDETNALISRTVELCSRLLGVELSEAVSPEGIEAETRFSHSFFEVPTILASILPDVGGVLPAEMVRKRALKRVRERTPEMVDKHCGRLRWDMAQRLDRSRLALEQLLDDRLSATIGSLRLGLDRALAERERGQERTAAAAAAAAAARAGLEEVAAEVIRVVSAVGLAPTGVLAGE